MKLAVTSTFRLIRIAGCKQLGPHAGLLPDDSTTLSKLVSLTDERFRELIDDGTINPNMGRKDGEVTENQNPMMVF